MTSDHLVNNHERNPWYHGNPWVQPRNSSHQKKSNRPQQSLKVVMIMVARIEIQMLANTKQSVIPPGAATLQLTNPPFSSVMFPVKKIILRGFQVPRLIAGACILTYLLPFSCECRKWWIWLASLRIRHQELPCKCSSNRHHRWLVATESGQFQCKYYQRQGKGFMIQGCLSCKYLPESDTTNSVGLLVPIAIWKSHHLKMPSHP